MSTIEIKHGDAVVTVHRRTPRSDMKRMSWLRRSSDWLSSIHESEDVPKEDMQHSVWTWFNAASRITVEGDIPIPLPNSHETGTELRAVYETYLNMDDPAGIQLADAISTAMNKLDQPFDDALAPVPPDDLEKKDGGKSGSKK